MARSIRTHVKEEINREINELISSDESFMSERRKITSELITDETITGVEVIAIEKDGKWWAIALKCREEYSKERKDYNMKYTYGVLIKINRISFSFSGYQSFIPMPAFNSYNGTISIGI